MKIEIKIPNKKTLTGLVAGIAVLIVLILFWGPRAVLFFQTRFLPFSSGWQAIYTVTGEVYIGRIDGFVSDTIKLSDTYLAQISKQNENNLGGKTNSFKLNGGSNNLTLIKWGFNQPLKSAGELFINKANVVFWEKLDKDSEVVKQLEAQK